MATTTSDPQFTDSNGTLDPLTKLPALAKPAVRYGVPPASVPTPAEAILCVLASLTDDSGRRITSPMGSGAVEVLLAELPRWGWAVHPLPEAHGAERLRGYPAAKAAQLLTKLCHTASSRAGWWVDARTEQNLVTQPHTFAVKLLLIISEVVEAMEGDRSDRMDDKLPHRPMREVELADALIRIFDLAGAYGLDVGGALVEKMAYNARRPDHKPEARVAAGGKKY